jgi:hypothetical protein
METTIAHVELDGIRLSDWIEQAGLSRSTAYELLKLLGIEPEARRVPTSRKPVSHISGEQIELLLPWVQEVQRGATLPQIRDRLGRNQTVPDDRPGQLDTIQDNSPGQSQIVPVIPDELVTALTAIASQQQHPGVPDELVTAVVTIASQQQQPVDPLRCARALAEAAQLGVALSASELAGVLGLSPATVSSWPDGHSPRPGFLLRRQKAGAAVWWTVDRPGHSQIVPADLRSGSTGQGRSVGFAQVLDVKAITLPGW